MTKHKKNHRKKLKKQQNKTISTVSTEPQGMPRSVQKSQKTRTSISFLKKIKGWFFGLLTIVCFCFGIHNYYPHVSIQETTLLQPYNPFYYPFIIKNTGKIKLKNFSFDLRASNLVDIHDNSFTNLTVSGFSEILNKIKVDGSHPIDLSRLAKTPPNYFKSCDIFIRYKYSVTILNFQFRDSTKFVLFKDPFKGYSWKEYQY